MLCTTWQWLNYWETPETLHCPSWLSHWTILHRPLCRHECTRMNLVWILVVSPSNFTNFSSDSDESVKVFVHLLRLVMTEDVHDINVLLEFVHKVKIVDNFCFVHFKQQVKHEKFWYLICTMCIGEIHSWILSNGHKIDWVILSEFNGERAKT